MKKFLLRTFLFFLPFAVPITLYAIIDPFGVLYTENHIRSVNRDFQSTEVFLSNYRQHRYDSFIFGNSRSIYYQASSWHRFIDGNIFHFDASSESIYGIDKKLDFIAGLKTVPIKNALLVLDVSVIGKTDNSKGHLFVKHPMISGENRVNFHATMFADFISVAMFAYSDLYFFNHYRSYMSHVIACDTVSRLYATTNELRYDYYEQQIKADQKSYYRPRKELFYQRNAIAQTSKCCIGAAQRQLLQNIHSRLVAFKTDFKIIISPLYDQKQINPKDLNYLKELFGSENVFDFSGKNRFTESYANYYETSHYRPVVCDSILSLVYRH